MEHENNGQRGWHADAAPPPSIYWKLEVGLIKAVCCRCRHGSKTPARACNLIRRGRREIPARLHFDHAPSVKVGQNRSRHFKLRTSDFALSVPPSRSRRLTSIDAMDRELRHTHTLSKRLVWRRRTHAHLLGLQFPEKDSAFDRQHRRRVGNR